MQHAVQEELRGVVTFIVVLWSVYFADLVLPIDFTQFGLQPRYLHGLIGIPLMPFLHAGFGHLLSNTFPLVILLVLLAGSRANSVQVVIEIVLLGGLFLWMFGRSSAMHVGASGLVYGLIAYLIASGLLERRLVSLAVSMLVLFLYGGTLLFGVLPSVSQHISWDGHLFGAIAGAGVAYVHTRSPIHPSTI
jgi:membrane associated rhomboid family serine protease